MEDETIVQCIRCGHLNQSGKFCVKCGASLEAAAASADAGFPATAPRQPQEDQATYAQQAQQQAQPQPQLQAQPQQQAQPQATQQARPHAQQPNTYGQGGQFNRPNPQLQQASQVANQFANLFVQALKHPLRVSEQTTAGQMGAGIITFVLFALFAPLVIYFDCKTLIGSAEDIPFGKVVLQPFVMLAGLALLANALIFLVLKLGNVPRSFKEVIARFGANSIPAMTVMLVAFLLAVLGSNETFVLALFGFSVFAWIVAIAATVYSFKKDNNAGGLDSFYGVLLTVAVLMLAVYLFREVLLEDFILGFKSLVWNALYFGGYGGGSSVSRRSLEDSLGDLMEMFK